MKFNKSVVWNKGVWKAKTSKKRIRVFRVSVQGVESLWGDCRFIPADLGS